MPLGSSIFLSEEVDVFIMKNFVSHVQSISHHFRKLIKQLKYVQSLDQRDRALFHNPQSEDKERFHEKLITQVETHPYIGVLLKFL